MLIINSKCSNREVAPRHTHTHFTFWLVSVLYVILEDVAVILGFLTNGLSVTEVTISSHEALEAECLHQFVVAPRKSDCRGSFIKLTCLRNLKDRLLLIDENSIQRYVKCHIMLLFGTILFGDKSGVAVHRKVLPLLRDFGSIRQTSHFDCKKIDGLLTLLLSWTWIRLPFLALIPRDSCIFLLANRSVHTDAINFLVVLLTLGSPDDLQKNQFVWEVYVVDRIEPNIIHTDIYIHLVVREFGFIQIAPHQERSLNKAHGKVLTGHKNPEFHCHSKFIIHHNKNFYHNNTMQ
ncbi:hypothetical protein Ahy_B01g055111 [Arachis hypogaea]|uniref:Aminotransferase-like plant mobile domain-containing protein n=1 Tax=Arachis hypogaea TaxID=3818 RepID=A0A445AVA0_ARAHY|nr:hypothetical protein Ahy_B01g055111 [Arachis hypogaea]